MTFGIGVVASDAFQVGEDTPNSVRACIGGMASREAIQHALEIIADTLLHPPVGVPMTV